MLYFFVSCLILCLLFLFVSRIFQKLERVEKKVTLDNNAPHEKYDVFVSFRGQDIRRGFLSHLTDTLRMKKIHAFVDDKLERGDEIWPSLVEAIEGSSLSLIIFSRDYASSRWCLEELVKILDCRERFGRIVIPVFYYVEPTNVRHQLGSYKDALAKHASKHKNKLQSWRSALKKSADLSGIESSKFQNDAELVKEIVDLVLKRLAKPPVNLKRLVGIDQNIADLESWIRKEQKDTRLIGIWGLAGVGKTTLAEEVFNKLRFEYDGSYFLANVKDQSNKHGVISLKEIIFSKLLGYDVKIDTPNSLPEDIVRRIGCMKFLIVLDGVNDSNHIEELLGNLDNFGSGSKIIITTRDEQVLKANKVDKTCPLNELSTDKAVDLFNLNAFNESDHRWEYNGLPERVVAYAHGIPLAVKVLAGLLRGKQKEEWKSFLDKLKKRPPKEVYNVMKLSYDDLDHRGQQIFLDLACFFLRRHKPVNVGDLEFLLKDNESDNSVAFELGRLKDKALITLSKDNIVSMDDSLQEMAWEIVRQESIEDPGSRTRLCDPDDIYEALKSDKGIEAIRSIRIQLPTIKKQKLSPEIFSKMSRLQFLEISLEHSHVLFDIHYSFAEGLQYLETELRFLYFDGYPLKSLPEKFSVEILVILSLRQGKMEKLWDGVKNLINLKQVDLTESKMLKELPDLSKAINLEVLLLSGCSKLTSVHPSIFSLNKLQRLDLSCCNSLTILTSDTHLCSLCYLNLDLCKNLTEFSLISENMKELVISNTKVKALPSSFEHQSKLEFLDLSRSDIQRLPSSIKNLRQLLHLDVSYCRKLQTLPELPPLLETLNVTSCTSLQTLPNLPPSIKTLNVIACKLLQTLPEFPPFLETLNVTGCTSLQTLPNLPPSFKTLNVIACKLLQTVPELPLSLDTLNTKFCDLLQTLPKLPPSLKNLDVTGCKLLQTLPKLPLSLKTLDATMCRSLQTLPELPLFLETLDVKDCVSLQTLAELPLFLKTLNATDCKTLKTVMLFPSTAVEQLEENRKEVVFWNCLNMDEHSLVAIGLNAQINMMKFANQHLSTQNDDHIQNDNDYQAVYEYPGSKVPEWLEYKTTKDCIIIDLSSPPPSPQLGFIFGFVLGKYQDSKSKRFGRLEVNLIISDSDRKGKKENIRKHIDYLCQSSSVSDHVCVIYDHRCSAFLNRRAKKQTRLKIKVTMRVQTWGPQTSNAFPQEVLKEFGVSPISTSAYNSFIQQMELHDSMNQFH